MSQYNALQKIQDENTAKLVMNTFYKVNSDKGATAEDVARYLQDKFGEVWRLNALVGKAEETLQRSAALGFLDRHGDRYIAKLTREMGCCRRPRRRRRRRSRCRRRKMRRSRCRRRPRRKTSCNCG